MTPDPSQCNESRQLDGQQLPDLLQQMRERCQADVPPGLVDDQVEHERRMSARGAAAVLQSADHAVAGLALHKMAKPCLDAAVRQWEQSRKKPTKWGRLIATIPSAKAVRAMVADAFLVVVNGGRVDGIRRNVVAAKIGARAELEALLHRPEIEGSWHRLQLFELNGSEVPVPQLLRRLRQMDALSHVPGWTHVQRVGIGTWLVETIAQETGLVEVRNMPSPAYPGQLDKAVFMTPAYWELVRRWKTAAMRWRVAHVPMLVPPKPYKGHDDGGYLTVLTPCLTVPRDEHHARTVHARLLLPTINRLQAQPWAVDMAQLEFTTQVWDQGGGVGSMPTREPQERPPAFEDGGTWRQRFAWLADLRRNGQRTATANSLAAAIQLEANDSLWCPWFADYRGRMYPRGPLSLHQPEHIRNLVEFRTPVDVTRADEGTFAWLLGDAAGQAKDRQARQDWFERSQRMILAVGRDPFGQRSAWQDMDEPFTFVRYARAWADLVDGNGSILTALPTRLDQSCSAYGHLACLTRDPVLASLANVTGDGYKDLYSVLGARARHLVRLQLLAERDPEAGRLLQFVLEHWPGRSVVKEAVMPLVYGRRQFSIQKQLRAHFVDFVGNVANEQGHRPMAMAVIAARALVAATREVMPTLSGLADWLKLVASMQMDAGFAPHWHTPDGLLVKSYGHTTDKQELTLYASGKKVSVQIKSAEDQPINRRKSLASVAPDFMHSVDAAFARSFAETWRGDLMVVHDCFATTLDRHQELHQRLLASFEAFYDQHNPLEQVRLETELLTGKDVPPWPGANRPPLEGVASNPALFA